MGPMLWRAFCSGSVTGVGRWVGTGIGVVGASVHVRPVSRFEFLTT
jgi:hypothetical protein